MGWPVLVVLVIVAHLILAGLLRKPLGKIGRHVRRLKTPFGEVELKDMDESSAAIALRLDETRRALTERSDSNAEKIGANSQRISEMDGRLADIEEIMRGMRMDQQKSMFFTDNVPLEERIFAGLSYIQLGGNHRTKEAVIRCCRENPALYRMAAKSSPRLAVDALADLTGGTRDV